MGRKKKSRREYKTGTVLRNNKLKRYTVRWYENGKHRSCSKFPLTPEGKQAAEAFLHQVNNAVKRPMSTVGDWVIAALKAKISTGRESTARMRKYAALRIPSDMLSTQIDSVKPQDIMDMYFVMQQQRIAVSTIHRVHSIMRTAFRLAKVNGATAVDATKDVIVPKNSGRPPIEVMSWRELGHVFLHLQRRQSRGRDNVLMFRMLYGLGCRIGELQALRWSDVLWQSREIHIQSTVSGPNGQKIESPKTRSGNRFVPVLSNHTWRMLQAAYEASNDKDGYIFAARFTGKPILYVTIHRIWRSCGINKKIHCFRHTRASHLIAAGLPIPEVSRILGHSTPAITMSIYAHALPRGNALLQNLYQQALSGK